MSAKILDFTKGAAGRAASAPPTGFGLPMSQVPPLPRVDLCSHHPEGRPDLLVHDVQYVRHDGAGGVDVLATFGSADEAEDFAENWMGKNSEMGGGQ